MAFFVMPYRLLFHDTMAYGSHHHVSNFMFQNLARETILFESKIDGQTVWQEQLKDLILLTREAYSLNLGPATLGQKVAILLSYEEPTRSTVRLCFRVVRQDGQPVSCGFQTMVCMQRGTLELVPAPPMITQYLDAGSDQNLIEKLTQPSFTDRLKQGGTAIKEIFSEEIIRLGKYVANAEEVHPRILDAQGRELGTELKLDKPPARAGLAFTFPGQGSFDPDVLRALYEQFPETVASFRHADATARQLLKQEFLLPILTPAGPARDRLLAANPDTTQIGIYLAGALIAKILVNRGLRPDLFFGHSIGELAALAGAGVYSVDAGVELVCKRVLALRGSNVNGGMAAVSCDASRAGELLRDFGPNSLEIAVINHSKQTVLSGNVVELDRFKSFIARHGVSLTHLQSPFPFHSSLLEPAVEPFRAALAEFPFGAARLPVYLGTEGLMWRPGLDLADIQARQFVKKLDFAAVVANIRESGITRFVECGAGEIVTRLVRKNLSDDRDLDAVAATTAGETLGAAFDNVLRRFGVSPAGAAPARVAEGMVESPPPAVDDDASVPEERALRTPIAIVAMGCVLPGAGNPEHYWRNITGGVGGIVDLTTIDANARADFMADGAGGPGIVPDKTYTLLNGSIIDIPYDSAALQAALTKPQFTALARGQKLLALALGQTLAAMGRKAPEPGRIQCVLGGTADGSTEFDEATLIESLQDDVERLDEPAETRAAFMRALEQACGYRQGEAGELSQHRAYGSVVDRFLPGGVSTRVIDSACSSSLYAVSLGVGSLLSGDADLVLAGGVFAPGPANNTLFAQFRGLSATGSRPLDKDADGVIFGDGAAVLALKRLPDALADGDRVCGVIRGIGLSSDGKSPAINVPQAKGQSLALRRALRQSGIQAETIQYIEAHATATQVGDRVELSALQDVFGERRPDLPRIELGSVKALIGHTGWVSGAASIIKICKAFAARVVPKQYNFNAPDPDMALDNSPFNIATTSREWPPNRNGYPRRAGINGFGFGGTNAHVILEEFDERYHSRLCKQGSPRPQPQRLCVVGVGSMFPGERELATQKPSGRRRFSRSGFPLPKKKIVLPDVTDHMDATQFLLPLAGEKILDGLPGNWTRLRDEIGVVVGLESKTERGVSANKRIFLDRLARLFRHRHGISSPLPPEAERLLNKLTAQIRSTYLPSGPYTLPGLMPNIAASRVSSLFDLKGPSMVIDSGGDSLFQALAVASDLLAQDDCKLVLAGAANAPNDADPQLAEAAFLLALTTETTAREYEFTALATFELPASRPEAARTVSVKGAALELDYRGARGATEILHALDGAARGDAACIVGEHTGAAAHPRPIVISPPVAARPPAAASGAKPEFGRTYAYVQDTPILRYTPTLVPEPAAGPPGSLKDRRLLILIDQPTRWSALVQSRALDALNYTVAMPAPLASDTHVAIDLSCEERMTQSLHRLGEFDFDTVLAIKFLDDRGRSPFPDRNLADERGVLELLFAVCRRDYDRIRDGRLPVVNLSIGPIERDAPDPCTGLTAGFIKSLARELPEARLIAVNTDESNPLKALRQVETELGGDRGHGEVCYVEGVRKVFKLKAVERLAGNSAPLLDKHSVVLATGGGRGVTAVLAEELLSRFGCSVVAVGRTDVKIAPEHVRAMEDAELREYESRFYKEEIARDPSQKMRGLKQRFASYQAANELSRTIRQLQMLPGSFQYVSADLGDADAVNRIVDAVYERHGRLDLVVHGAGIQVSGMLTKKALDDFRRIIDAKLASFRNIYAAVSRRKQTHAVSYHLLTSAFSYMGNDGQPDYGAANETLNRIAAWQNDPARGVHWSSMAWLGWAGIGMTRGSEFAALAANRRLRGITREEGRELFGEMMGGAPTVPINILMAEGEIKYYGVAIAEPQSVVKPAVVPIVAPSRQEQTFEWSVTMDDAPFLDDHRVNGTPTLPAAFMTCVVADAAKKLRPDLNITAYENTHYRRFVKVLPERGVNIRAHARVVSEGDAGAVLHVRILSDFVHKSGAVLQKDIVHNETVIRMSPSLPNPPANLFAAGSVNGGRLPDPYVLPGSNVQLNGQFASTREIRVGPDRRIGSYRLADWRYPASKYGYLLPNMILVDAFWRFGTVQWIRDQTLGVYVPERCGVMRVYFDYTAFDAPQLTEPMMFRGANPRADGDLLHVGPIELSDSTGRVLLVVEDGVCHSFGEVDTAVQRGNGSA